jgi:hypothetical protein
MQKFYRFRLKPEAGQHQEQKDGVGFIVKPGEEFTSPIAWHEITPEKVDLLDSAVGDTAIQPPAKKGKTKKDSLVTIDVTESFPDAAKKGLVVIKTNDLWSIQKDGIVLVQDIASEAEVNSEISDFE